MAELKDLIDLEPTGFGKNPKKGTVILNKNYVNDGNSYELRYAPENGTLVLYRKYGNSYKILFQSTSDGKYQFSVEADTLLTANLLKAGDGTVLTRDTLYQRLRSDAEKAAKTIKLPDNIKTVVNPIVNNPTSPETLVGVADGLSEDGEFVEPEKTDGEESNDNNSSLLDRANELVEGVINTIETNILGGDLKLDDFLLKGNLDVKFGAVDDAIRGTFKYPEDAIYDKSDFTQDYIQIVQFSYKPPYKENIFSGKGGAVNILTGGSERTTPFKKYIGMVKLPMPNSISDSNSVNWGEDQMNDLNMAILNSFASAPRDVIKAAAVGGFASSLGLGGAGRLATFLALLKNAGGVEGLKNIIKSPNSGGLVQSAVSSRVLALAGIQVSPESILARGFGVVPNSNMELLFNSPTLRSFQFSWKLSPRDKNEALMVNKIVRFFKQGMAVKKQTGTSGAAGGRSLFLGTPNIFKLNFKTQGGSDISGVNKIKACAIKSCSVNYTPEQIWASYERGQPVSIQISLTVQELEPIYDTDYQEVTDEKRLFTVSEPPTSNGNFGDLDSIRANKDTYDVGY